MDVTRCTNDELLSLLLGQRSAQMLSGRTLAGILGGHDVSPRVHSRLLAARELVRRALAEELRRDSVLNTPTTVSEYLRVTLSHREEEHFMVLFLDSQNRLIVAEEMFRGTISQTAVYPREVVKRALKHNASGVIFAHNHPSGVAEPSRADEALTNALKQALALVDVRVLDHFVVAGPAAVSFAERGLV